MVLTEGVTSGEVKVKWLSLAVSTGSWGSLSRDSQSVLRGPAAHASPGNLLKCQ